MRSFTLMHHEAKLQDLGDRTSPRSNLQSGADAPVAVWCEVASSGVVVAAFCWVKSGSVSRIAVARVMAALLSRSRLLTPGCTRPFRPARVDEVQTEVRGRQSGLMRRPSAEGAERVLCRAPDTGCVRGALVEGGTEGTAFDCEVGERFGSLCVATLNRRGGCLVFQHLPLAW